MMGGLRSQQASPWLGVPVDPFVIPVPVFGISASLEAVIWTIFGGLALLTLVIAGRWARELGSSFPYFICLGAVLAVPWDAVIDTLARVTWHRSHLPPLYTAISLPIPIWMIFMYVFYIGLTVIMQMKWVEAGFTLKAWMGRYILFAAGSVLLEIPLIALHVLHYYGANQPFGVFGYPLWIGFSNASLLFVMPVGLHFLRLSRAGQRWPALFAPSVPMLLLASAGVSALPAGIAMNGSNNVTVTNIGAVLSIITGFVLVGFAGLLAIEQRRDPSAG